MSEESKANLIESFDRYFKVQLVTSEQQKMQVFALRYRVYCQEFRYESGELFSDGLERDEYDHNSWHCLIIHRSSGVAAGCVRLVPAMGSRDLAPLPMERYCGSCLDQSYIDQLNLDRSAVCEISRLAVDAVFRRRTGENLTRYGDINGLYISSQEQRTFSTIGIACFLAAIAMAEITNRTNIFAMMEPFLPRMIQRSGIDFMPVGRAMDYHGIRIPYFITTQTVIMNMQPELLDLYRLVKTNLEIEIN